VTQHSNWGLGCLIVEVSISHTHTLTSGRTPLPTQRTTNTRDEHPCPQRDSNLRFHQPHGHRYRLVCSSTVLVSESLPVYRGYYIGWERLFSVRYVPRHEIMAVERGRGVARERTVRWQVTCCIYSVSVLSLSFSTRMWLLWWWRDCTLWIRNGICYTIFLDAFAKLRKAIVASSCPSVCLSAWNNSAHWTDFDETWYFNSWIILRMRYFSNKSSRENLDTHFVCSNFFFSEIVPFMK
jgi:hypothetical protein